MANLYARVRAKGWEGDSRNGDGQRTCWVLDRGDLIQPSRGKPQIPSALDAQPIDINATGDRREALAGWLTSPENPYFSRAIVQSCLGNFMGQGLVELVDDLRVSTLRAASVYLASWPSLQSKIATISKPSCD